MKISPNGRSVRSEEVSSNLVKTDRAESESEQTIQCVVVKLLFLFVKCHLQLILMIHCCLI